MYQEIVESLQMTPVKYIGKIKRAEITFNIRHQQKQNSYREEKLQIVQKSLSNFHKNKSKTLVYVPFIKHINEILESIDFSASIGRYFGSMKPADKKNTLESLKDDSKSIVIATKAFGMGIDIDDIENIYHFAPTGNIADYVQEIGRVARKDNMEGTASTDFFKEDFRYVNQLYGMSSIKNFQVKAVLYKINQLYKRYKRRNFLVSPETFSYIFGGQNIDDIDAKLKTTLLIIKKDFDLDPDINYAPLVFKPRGMFTVGFFMIPDASLTKLKNSGFLAFCKKKNYSKEKVEFFKKASPCTTTFGGNIFAVNFKGFVGR